MAIKPLTFLGDSLEQVRKFPDDVRRDAGAQLYRVQLGMEPVDWRPMADIGAGVREIRLRDPAGIFRVIYLVKTEHGVFVLHAFQKKTEKTAQQDKKLAVQRLKRLHQEI